MDTVNSTFSGVYPRSFFEEETNVDEAMIAKSVDALIQFAKDPYIELVSGVVDQYSRTLTHSLERNQDECHIPHGTLKISGHSLENESESQYSLTLVYQLSELSESPIKDLLIQLSTRVTQLFLASKVIVRFEKGVTDSLAKNWHFDNSNHSLITCWSNVENWITHFQPNFIENVTQPGKFGCFYDAARTYHRSPILSDFKASLPHGKVEATMYRLFIQFINDEPVLKFTSQTQNSEISHFSQKKSHFPDYFLKTINNKNELIRSIIKKTYR